MRASEIRPGNSYAVTGRDIQLARVRVLKYDTRPDIEKRFSCVVEAGEVYTGWSRSGPGLDMTYASPGELVDLSSRDILRLWVDEQERRNKVMTQRSAIRSAMSEMDQLLTELGLPDAQVQLVQHPYGYLAVTVLGIEDLRKLRDNQKAGERPSATEVDQEVVGVVPVPPAEDRADPDVPGSTG